MCIRTYTMTVYAILWKLKVFSKATVSVLFCVWRLSGTDAGRDSLVFLITTSPDTSPVNIFISPQNPTCACIPPAQCLRDSSPLQSVFIDSSCPQTLAWRFVIALRVATVAPLRALPTSQALCFDIDERITCLVTRYHSNFDLSLEIKLSWLALKPCRCMTLSCWRTTVIRSHTWTLKFLNLCALYFISDRLTETWKY